MNGWWALWNCNCRSRLCLVSGLRAGWFTSLTDSRPTRVGYIMIPHHTRMQHTLPSVARRGLQLTTLTKVHAVAAAEDGLDNADLYLCVWRWLYAMCAGNGCMHYCPGSHLVPPSDNTMPLNDTTSSSRSSRGDGVRGTRPHTTGVRAPRPHIT